VNNDTYLDFLIGNYQGGVAFYKGVEAMDISDKPQNNIFWNLEVFPNPANSTFTVQIMSDKNANYILELFDVIGQKIGQQKISENKITINTESLKSGIYFCKVSETDHSGVRISSCTKKIIIQH
jgi:hypothetical protein